MESPQIASEGTIFLSVSQEAAGTRIDTFLAQKVPTLSRNFFQKMLHEGCVSVNEKIINKYSYALKEKDVVLCTLPAVILSEAKIVNSSVKIDILHEHEHFFIIHKPVGLLVHAPNHRSDEATLTDWLVTQHNEIKNIGFHDRPGIVHRIDKNTSGLLVIARTSYAHMVFGRMFHDRLIKKTYLAVVEGHPLAQGSIDFPIARDPFLRTKMTHRLSHGRESLTHYAVERYFAKHSLVHAHPITGRTHQIRVHFAGLGYPLVGDSVYGSSSTLINRQALHAWRISFTFLDQDFSFEAPIEKDLQELIDILTPI